MSELSSARSSSSEGDLDECWRHGGASIVYGRTSESLALLKAYQTVLRTSSSQYVIVHGESGSGKTALVNELRDMVCTTHGHFVTGKYFQNASVQEPHSAIMAAFSDLCDLVTQSEDFTEIRRQTFQEALGADAHLLVKSISNLTPFVGNVFRSDPIEREASVAKFKIACKTFLHTMASKEHPVTIFLDDIQWADEGSSQLIRILLEDKQLKNMLFIFAYRDEEAAWAKKMLDGVINPIDIQLSPLNAQAVFQIVSSITGSSSEKTRHLSELVSKRTGGNPLHVKMFMENIQWKKAQALNHSACNFYVEQGQKEVMVPITLAELLEGKIGLLSSDTTDTLKVASLIGYYFPEEVVIDAATNAIDSKRYESSISCKGNSSLITTSETGTRSMTDKAVVKSFLSEAVKEGFLERTSDGYTFTHDKVQASFQHLISTSQKDMFHYFIGKAFLSSSSINGEGTRRSFEAAVHLNQSSGFLSGKRQRAELARLNLDASKYCEEKSAFSHAVKMLQKGLAVLGSDPTTLWSENHNLTFQIMESLARIQLIVGDFEGCMKSTKEALNHGKTVAMKINLLVIDVEVRLAELAPFEESMLAASCALKTLGVKIPSKVKPWHAMAKLLKIRRMLKGMSNEAVLGRPVRHDAWTSNIVKILMHIYSLCLAKHAKSQAIHAALMAVEVTLEHGLTPHSSSAFVSYAAVEVALGRIDQAYRYGHLALRVLDRVGCKEAECTTVALATVLLLYRREALAQLAGPLAQAANSGLERGDVLYGTFCCAQSFQMYESIGTNLEVLEAFVREKYDLVSDLSQDAMIMWLQYGLQSVINMRSEVSNWDKIAVLTGEVMDEDDVLSNVTIANHPVLAVCCWITKAQIACYFDQYSNAAAIYRELEQMNLDVVRMGFGASYYFWNAARTFYSLFEVSGRRRDLWKARKYRRWLQQKVSSGCPSAIPLEAFLVAQDLARATHINEEDLDLVYERGIKQMADAKLIHLEGLMNEKAGFDNARRGRHTEADRFFDRALSIYQHDWGATAKYFWLIEQRSSALKKTSESLSHTLNSSPCGKVIEVAACAE